MKFIEPEPAMSEKVAAEIRGAIMNGSLAPSSRIRQEDLAGRLGVSRAPIRQALVMLEHEGLIRTVPNRGTIVAPVDGALIREIYEFRGVMDGFVAARVAARKDFDPSPLRAIVKQGRAAVRSGDMGRLIELDLAFHEGLYKAVGNRVITEVMRTQWGHIRRAMITTLTMKNYRKQFWDEHTAILEAIARGDAAQASTLATAHTRSAQTLLAEMPA
jgi:DNA-binding GntR family transcriptional regulator